MEAVVWMARQPLRVLHTSDFHLGAYGDRDRESLESAVALIPQHRAGMFIIAGDLFDHNRVDQDLVRFAAEKLQNAPCPVFIAAGNHDCLVPGSIYDRFGIWRTSTNISIFRGARGEVFRLPGLGVSIWGKSIDYDDRDVDPLEGIPQPELNGNWNIAVAHGYYVGKNPVLFPSYHINEAEIAGLGWDYIALGHVPRFKRMCSQPMTYYSGSPSFSRTAALVEFSEENGIRVSRCDLAQAGAE